MEVVSIGLNGSLRDIPTKLRALADEVVAGKHGDLAKITTCAVVLGTEQGKPQVFSYGDRSTLADTYYLLCQGVRFLDRI